MTASTTSKRIARATLLLLFSLLVVQADCEEADLSDAFRILPDSHLIIEGESNINSFRYRYTDLPCDPEKQVIGDVSSIVRKLLQNSLALKLESFDSGHGKMNSDFRKLLNAKVHPAILISVETLAAFDADGRPTGLASRDAALI